MMTAPAMAGSAVWWRWMLMSLAGMIVAAFVLPIFVGPIVMVALGAGMAAQSALGRATTVALFALAALVEGGLGLAILAALQWVVLPHHLPPARPWIFANALGGIPAGVAVVAMVTVLAAAEPVPAIQTRMVVALVLAFDLLLIAAAQARAMRRRLTRPVLWVVAGGVSGLAGGALLAFTSVSILWILLASALLFPALTGLALVRLSHVQGV
jgi:hypothetical protein